MKARIYIASPYTVGDQVINVKKQIDMGYDLNNYNMYQSSKLFEEIDAQGL